MKLTFATRPSALARWQTGWVIGEMQRQHRELECVERVITTTGDVILDRPLPEIGGKGLFTQELEAELLSGRVQAAVHSLKDLPVENPPGLCIGAVPVRAEVRDALISGAGFTLNTLPKGAVVGTSSLRRQAQLLALRPDLTIHPLRGNVDTRLRKALENEYDAVVLAGAGLQRLGLDDHVTEWLSLDVMLPAPGQGALAVQCRSDDAQTLKQLEPIEDPATRLSVTAERSFLQALGGGCSVPVAAIAQVEAGRVVMRGLVASVDGKKVIHIHGIGDNPHILGRMLANEALDQGAQEILSQSVFKPK